MADPESCFTNALSTISLHANTVWWNEGRDSYRLTNFSTWLDYLRSKAMEQQPLAEDQTEQADTSSSRSDWNPPCFQQMDYPEALVSDPESWLRGHAWPSALARNFPDIPTALSTSGGTSLFQYRRVLERMYEESKPYKIETIDELKLYRKTSKESIKKVWTKTEVAPTRKDPSLNANVPEFYPSVLFHHVDFPQPYPPIVDQTYHMELFPFHEQNVEPENQWQVPQMQVYPSSNPENYPPEWRGRPNTCSFANLLLLQKTQKGPFVQGGQMRGGLGRPPTPGSQQRLPFQVYAGPSPQPQQILLNSDFPELPTVRGNDPCATGRRNSGFPEICTFTEKTPEEMLELSSWLETAYPQRAAAFADLDATTCAFEEMTRRMSGQTRQEPQQQVVIPNLTTCGGRGENKFMASSQISQEPRRLYRDVLASKGEDDSETTMEVKFDELEREALEQYISSENSGEVVEAEEPPPDGEDPYQDLERQAVEQYDEHGDADDRVSMNDSSSIPASPATSTQTSSQNYYNSRGGFANPDIRHKNPVFPNNCHKENGIISAEESKQISSIYERGSNTLRLIEGNKKHQTTAPVWPRASDFYRNQSSVNEREFCTKIPSGSSVQRNIDEEVVRRGIIVKSENIGINHPYRPNNEEKPVEEGGAKRKVREWRNKKGRKGSEASCNPLSTGSFRSSSLPPAGRELQLQPTVLPSYPASPRSHGRPKQTNPPRLAFDGQRSAHKRRDIHSHINLRDGQDLKALENHQSLNDSLRTSDSHISTQDKAQKTLAYVRKDKKEFGNHRYKIMKTPIVKQSIDADVKTLVNSLKIRALNFLKDVEKKHLNEEKLAIRELLYRGEKEKIRQQIAISDIQNTDTFKLYVKEMSALSRQHMDCIYKRVRKDILEMRVLHVAQPSATEKRKVRYLIKKCLQLQEKADYLINIKKLPKKPLESSRREIADTLTTIHKTMDIVYNLRDMCREAKEDLDDMRLSRQSLSEVVYGEVLLEDMSPAIRHRLQEEYRSLLLYSMSPKGGTILYDRVLARLQSNDHMYALPLDMAINNYLLFNERIYCTDVLNVAQIRFLNTPVVEQWASNEFFGNKPGTRLFILRNKAFIVNLIIEESIKPAYLPGFLFTFDIEKRLRLKETKGKAWEEFGKGKSDALVQGKTLSIVDRCSCAIC